jgi:hypothetical protein
MFSMLQAESTRRKLRWLRCKPWWAFVVITISDLSSVIPSRLPGHLLINYFCIILVPRQYQKHIPSLRGPKDYSSSEVPRFDAPLWMGCWMIPHHRASPSLDIGFPYYNFSDHLFRESF